MLLGSGVLVGVPGFEVGATATRVVVAVFVGVAVGVFVAGKFGWSVSGSSVDGVLVGVTVGAPELNGVILASPFQTILGFAVFFVKAAVTASGRLGLFGVKTTTTGTKFFWDTSCSDVRKNLINLLCVFSRYTTRFFIAVDSLIRFVPT